MALIDYLVRPPSGTAVRSPLTHGRAEAGVELDQAGSVTAREVWGYVVWGVLTAVFLLFELSALDVDTKWPTLSTTAANLQSDHPWTAMLILGGLSALAARIVFYPWPNRRYDA